jgi:hypothetical protein
MNERHNRLAACKANMETACKRVDCLAGVIAQRMVELEDSGNVTPEAVATILGPYRAASESLADALDQLADALRQ